MAYNGTDRNKTEKLTLIRATKTGILRGSGSRQNPLSSTSLVSLSGGA